MHEFALGPHSFWLAVVKSHVNIEPIWRPYMEHALNVSRVVGQIYVILTQVVRNSRQVVRQRKTGGCGGGGPAGGPVLAGASPAVEPVLGLRRMSSDPSSGPDSLSSSVASSSEVEAADSGVK